jgi:hypothetical protein
MSKYKNKDGIELNYTSLRGDYHTSLVKEVIGKAIKILGEYNRNDLRSAEWAIHRGISFLEENFDIEENFKVESKICTLCNRNDGTCGCGDKPKCNIGDNNGM